MTTISIKQTGFTVFELVIAMTVMSILAAPFVYQKIQEFEEDRIEIAVAEINDLFQSAQNYAAEEDGGWPGEAGNCANAINVMEGANYLEGFNIRSPFGTNVATSCTTGAGKRFMVTVDAGEAGNAELLDGYLPSSTVTGSLVTVSVPMPAAIPALEHLLPRDGSRKMTGNLNMDGNNIRNANRVDAERVLLKSIVSKGAGCGKNGLVARDNQGNLLSCVAGRWKGPEGAPARMVGYFNRSRCPDGWVESNGNNGTVDLRGEFIRGWDHGRGVDSGRGRNTFQNYAIQSHRHRTSIPRSYWMGRDGRNPGVVTDNSLTSSMNRNSSYTGGDETRPRNRAMLVCQKQ